jgi:segregation and condensation protein B
MEFWEMKACIGAILVAADEPVKLEIMAKGMGVTEIQVEDALREYEADLMGADQGVQIRHLPGGVRLEVKPQYNDAVGRVLHKWSPSKLTDAASWTLAFIALHQPVTISEINAQRNGTDSSAAVQTLRNRKLVAREAKLGPRRQKLWCTTAHFLEVFKLSNIEEFRQEGTKERIFPDLFNDNFEEQGEGGSEEIEQGTSEEYLSSDGGY